MKHIKNFEDLYAVTPEGDVYSLGRGDSNNSKFKKLKPFLTGKLSNRYPTVKLYKDGKYTSKRVHRLVAETYIENPGNHPHINHKDENTMNNHVDNLEWCTAQYNKEYSSSVDFVFVHEEHGVVSGNNLSKFCREKGLSNGSLYSVISGRYTHHKGWRLLLS